jgi:uncharacterized protein
MATWTCIQGCGACCHLDLSERPDVQEYLSAEEFERYLSLIGPDGWCIHFNHADRSGSVEVNDYGDLDLHSRMWCLLSLRLK